MSFKQTPQKFNASIGTVEMGVENKITLGGENVLPFYTFDGGTVGTPKIGVEVVDTGVGTTYEGLTAYYGEDVVGAAKKACELEGADFVCLSFNGADPNGLDKSVEECVELAKAVAEVVTKPLMIAGCKSAEKNTALFDKVGAALEGKNVVLFSAQEENYKGVAASAVMAYGHKVSAESSVDINLAKQLNVLISQMGIAAGNSVMNPGSAAAGYGFEYVASTIQRIKLAALSQNDVSLQSPMILPVSAETWGVKEAIASEADQPEWGNVEDRAINMEIVTAAACLAAGANAVIVKHPKSVETLSTMIKELL